MKYIFLDYDGVIKPFSKTNESIQDESICMGYLTDMIEELDGEVSIVLTTDNRYSYSFEELKRWFPPDISAHIVAQTTTDLYVPSAKEHYDQYIETRQTDIRDREIALYINENGLDPEDCVAIDDIWEITCIPMVKTISEYGLTEEDAVAALEYLAGTRPFYNLSEEITTLTEF